MKDCLIIKKDIKKEQEKLQKRKSELLGKEINKDGIIEDPFNTNNNSYTTTINDLGEVVTEIKKLDKRKITGFEKKFNSFLHKVNILNDFGNVKKTLKGNVEAESLLNLLIKNSTNLDGTFVGKSIVENQHYIHGNFMVDLLQASSFEKNNFKKLLKEEPNVINNLIGRKEEDLNIVVTEIQSRLEHGYLEPSNIPESILNIINVNKEIKNSIRENLKLHDIEYGDIEYHTPQIFNDIKFQQLMEEIGYDEIVKMTKKSIIAKHKELGVNLKDKKVINTINEMAEAKVRRQINSSYGSKESKINTEILKNQNTFYDELQKIIEREPGKIEELLNGSKTFDNYDKKLITELIDDIMLSKNEIGFTKSRIQLDPFTVHSVNGKDYMLNDAFEMDNQLLMNQFTRNYSVEKSLLEVGNIKLENGSEFNLRSFNSYDSYLSSLRKKGINTKELEDTITTVRRGGDFEEVIGNGNVNALLEIGRNVAGGTYLSRVWMASMAEESRAMASNNMRMVFKHSTLAARVVSDMKKPMNEWSEESKLLYKNNKHLMIGFFDNATSYRGESNSLNNISGSNGVINKVLKISQKYSSFMIRVPGQLQNITLHSKVLSHLGIRHSFMNDIFKNGKLDMDDFRMRDIGLSKNDVINIKKQIEKYPPKDFDDILELELSIEKWDDKTLRNLFDSAVQKKVSEIVLDPVSGESLKWMKRNAFVKNAVQFQTFVTAAYGSNTLKGLNHRDKEALVLFLAQLPMMSITQAIKNYDSYTGDKLDEKMDIVKFSEDVLFSTTELAGPANLFNTLIGLTPFENFIKDNSNYRGHSNLLSPPSLQALDNIRNLIGKSIPGTESLKYEDIRKVSPILFMFGLKTFTGLDEELKGEVFD